MNIDIKPFCTPVDISKDIVALYYSSHVTPLHSHDTLQIIIDLKTGFLFRTRDTQWNRCRGVIVKDQIPHQLDTDGSLQFIIYIAPGSETGSAIKRTCLENCDWCTFDHFLSSSDEDLLLTNLFSKDRMFFRIFIEGLIDKILKPSIHHADERIDTVMRQIRESSAPDISTDSLARNVYISPSRLRALFKKATGTTLHNFILRHKLINTINYIINGSRIADAVFKSGFSDQSHFNKTLTNYYRVSPSKFLNETKSHLALGLLSTAIYANEDHG